MSRFVDNPALTGGWGNSMLRCSTGYGYLRRLARKMFQRSSFPICMYSTWTRNWQQRQQADILLLFSQREDDGHLATGAETTTRLLFDQTQFEQHSLRLVKQHDRQSRHIQ